MTKAGAAAKVKRFASGVQVGIIDVALGAFERALTGASVVCAKPMCTTIASERRIRAVPSVEAFSAFANIGVVIALPTPTAFA